MESLFMAPVKVFLTGLLLAMVVTFTWLSVELFASHDAAVNAAHSAAADPAHYLTAAQGAASTTLPGAEVQSVQQAAPDVVSSTVQYQPQNIFPNVFQYLGAPNPNQMITITGTAPGILSTIVLTFPDNMSPNQAITITGTLKDINGNPLQNQTIILNASGGSFSQNIVTTNASGSFSVTYTSPGIQEKVSISATGDGITTTGVISVAANIEFYAMPITYINQTVTISGYTSPSEPNEAFTLKASAGTLANGGVTTTDSNGDWSIQYTAPSTCGAVTLSADVFNNTGSLNVLGPTISFNPSTYDTLIGEPIAITGTTTLGSGGDDNQALGVTAGGTEGGAYPSSTTTNSSGGFSITYSPPMSAGTETFAASGGGSVSNVATVNVENITTNLTATDDGNGNITLTATVNLPLNGYYTLSIINQTTGTTLASTTTGTSLTYTVPVPSGTTYKFIAEVTN